MSAPVASLSHESPGRMRLRVRERRGDVAWLSQLRDVLCRAPGVYEARVNPLTGSVLVLHDGEREAIEQFCRNEGMLAGFDSELHFVEAYVERRLSTVAWLLEDPVRRQDPNTFAFFALLAASVWRSLHGRPLPAGETLLAQALRILNDAEAERRRERERSSRRPVANA